MKLFASRKKTSAHTNYSEIKEAVSDIGHEPHVDWVLILIVGAVTCGTLVLAGYFSFVRVGNILSQTSNADAASRAAIDASHLTTVLEQFQSRDRERQDLIRVYKGPSDPSI